MSSLGSWNLSLGLVVRSPLIWTLFVSLNTAYVFMTRVERPWIESRLILQKEIVDGTALEPFRFRILIPWLASEVETLLSQVTSTEWAHLLTFFILNTSFLWLVLQNIWTFNERVSFQSKLISILLFGFAANVGLFDQFYQPWTLLEAAIVSTAFRQSRDGRLIWLPFFGVIGTLNRDTGVLLPVMIFIFTILIGKMNSKNFLLIFGSGILAFMTFLSLRIFIGPAAQVTSLHEILATNLSFTGILKLAVNLGLMFGVAWFLASWRGIDSIYRKIWISFLPYFVFIAIFGIWLEVRLLLPLVWVLAIQIGESFERLGNERLGSVQQLSGDERI